MLLVALGAFSFILRQRIRLLLRAAPDPRLDHLGVRLRRLLVVGFLQSRQPRYLVAGLLHILIFAGFLLLLLRSASLLAEGFHPGASDLGHGYAVVKDWTGLVVLLCCATAALRRALVRPARYRDRLADPAHAHGSEAYLILGLISLLMVADACFEGAGPGPRAGMPLASAAACLLQGLPPAAREGAGLAGFWVHNAALLFFLCYLPVSKHFHVLSALPNVFLSKLPPSGRLKPPVHGVRPGREPDRMGVGRLEDFTWKHILDFYSCTDCGRCSDACPAYTTGAPLSPRLISIKSRDYAYAAYPILGAPRPPAGDFVGDVLTEGEIWSCTTCGACEETCPVLIEYVDKIVDLRRHLVEEGRVPKGLQKPLADLERRGNPYGKLPRKRGEWAAGTAVKELGPGEEADCIFFTDSCAAYDPRIQQTAKAFAAALEAAGVVAGILGKDEVDSGHEARRMGEEGLFEMLRDRNLEALAARPAPRAIVTTDPHALNALRHDYEGLDRPVRHHTQVLAELLREGRLNPRRGSDGRTYTFHDPCYLGRHNGEFDAPREVLEALGLDTVEMERSRSRSFCCGGGSLYLFQESEGERRMGEVRVEMAARAGADVIVTACPFCLINLEDAIKTTGREGALEVLDIAELVARRLEPAAPRPTEKEEKE